MLNTIYESDRLTLRILQENHTSSVLRFLIKNRTIFDCSEGEKPYDFYSWQFIHDMLRGEYQQILKGNALRYYVFCKNAPSTIIGTISFSGFRHEPYHSCHIGYKFDYQHQRQGYAYESITELLGYVIPEYHLHRIEAHIQQENQASIRLARRLGFEYEGIARHYAKIHGVWLDHLQYSLICSE